MPKRIVEPGEGRLGGSRSKNPPPGMGEGLQRAHAKTAPFKPEAHAAISVAAQRLAAPPAYLSLDPAAKSRWERAYLSSVVGSPALAGVPRTKAIRAIQSQRDSFKKQNVTLEGTSDLVIGKGLTNLVQGQGPHSPKDVLGLGIDAALLLPPSKLVKGAAAGLDAARATTREAGGVRPLLAGETGSIFGRRPVPDGKVPKAIESQGIRDKFRDPVGDVRSKFPSGSASGAKALPKSAAPESGAANLFGRVPPILSPEEQIREAMPTAKRGYNKQATARSAEKSRRAAKASEAYRTIEDPFEADRAARAALKGPLPKNELNAVPEMTHEGLAELKKTVQHYDLWEKLPFQKVKTNQALEHIFHGGQPAPHQIKLIEQVFGPAKTREIAAATGGNWGDVAVNAINIPRSLQSTLDISGTTRQAFVAMTTHPIIWGKATPSYIKAFRSGNYRLIDQAVKNDPLYPLAVGHVSFSGIGDGVSLAAHEEAFASEYATKIPGIGRAVKGSAQGYVAFLNKLRMDMFSHFVRLEVKAGRDPHREEFLKSVGDIVNAATGRGAIHGRLEHMMPAANTLLYSPRLMLSRLNYFDPTWYVRLKGRRARIEALKGLFATTAYVTSVVTLLSQIPGVDVGSTNPISSDFGKLRIGDTRVDMAAGFLQYIHLAAMLEENAKINSTSGNRIEFGSGFGKQNRWDQIQNFFVNKAAPPVSFTIGMARGHDPVGDPMSLSSPGAAAHVAGNMFIPLAIQDAQSLYKQKQGGLDGITAAIAGYGASGIGLGLQTYGAAKPKGSGTSNAAPGVGGSDNPPPGWGAGGGNSAP